CIEGAAMNVRINLGQLKDKKFKIQLQERVQKVTADSEAQFNKINQVVESKLGRRVKALKRIKSVSFRRKSRNPVDLLMPVPRDPSTPLRFAQDDRIS